MCGKEYINKGINWLRFIGEKEKQGLKILSAVIKHRGTKKFKSRPKASFTSLAQQSIGTNSFLKLDGEALEKYKLEYKKSMYKSAYGDAFGRKETDLADAGILSHKKFSQLPCSKVLNSSAKAFITRWSESGEDKSYLSLAVLVVKGIFTHWKQSLPSQTVSHINHAWNDPHNMIHNQRIDKVGKAFLESRITKATAVQRPQTTSNLLRRNHNKNLIPQPKKNKNDKGLDGVIQNRKKFLLRGNGNITGFYNPPDGMVSSYQAAFKSCKSTKTIQKTAGNKYTSSIMTVTPDPNTYKQQNDRSTKMKTDLGQLTQKYAGMYPIP